MRTLSQEADELYRQEKQTESHKRYPFWKDGRATLELHPYTLSVVAIDAGRDLGPKSFLKIKVTLTL